MRHQRQNAVTKELLSSADNEMAKYIGSKVIITCKMSHSYSPFTGPLPGIAQTLTQKRVLEESCFAALLIFKGNSSHMLGDAFPWI